MEKEVSNQEPETAFPSDIEEISEGILERGFVPLKIVQIPLSDADRPLYWGLHTPDTVGSLLPSTSRENIIFVLQYGGLIISQDIDRWFNSLKTSVLKPEEALLLCLTDIGGEDMLRLPQLDHWPLELKVALENGIILAMKNKDNSDSSLKWATRYKEMIDNFTFDQHMVNEGLLKEVEASIYRAKRLIMG